MRPAKAGSYPQFTVRSARRSSTSENCMGKVVYSPTIPASLPLPHAHRRSPTSMVTKASSCTGVIRSISSLKKQISWMSAICCCTVNCRHLKKRLILIRTSVNTRCCMNSWFASTAVLFAAPIPWLSWLESSVHCLRSTMTAPILRTPCSVWSQPID